MCSREYSKVYIFLSSCIICAIICTGSLVNYNYNNCGKCVLFGIYFMFITLWWLILSIPLISCSGRLLETKYGILIGISTIWYVIVSVASSVGIFINTMDLRSYPSVSYIYIFFTSVALVLVQHLLFWVTVGRYIQDTQNNEYTE